MTAEESIHWLYSAQTFGVKLGLDNTRALLAALDQPHAALNVIHVAGTNGKGSTCALLDSVLREHGLRTGLYTSPHLVDFSERIRVNGVPIPDEALAAGLTRIREICEKWDAMPSFFEIATVLALRHFADAACEAVVLETGMGGRLDATNVVHPRVSVLTPIAMDHSRYLGETLAAIAGEKAGIMKPGVPAVSAPQVPEAAAVFREAAIRMRSDLSFLDSPYVGEMSLMGSHQRWNAALAVAALRKSGWEVSGDSIRRGMAHTQWPGRFQRVGEDLVVDGAHNPHGIAALCRTWAEVFPGESATVIFGAMRDKNVPEMIAALKPIASSWVFVPVRSERSEDPFQLAHYTGQPSQVADSLAAAMSLIGQAGGRVLVTGSLFLVGETLAFVREVPAARRSNQ